MSLQNKHLYEFGAFVLDPEPPVLLGTNGVVGLPPKVITTLVALVERRGELITKQELMDIVWPDSFVEEANLTQNIFLLRKELGKTAEGQDYIQTLAKRGYRLNVPVVEIERLSRESGAKPVAIGSAEPDVQTTEASLTEAAIAGAGGQVRPRFRPATRIFLMAISALILALIVAFVWTWRTALSRPTVSGYVQITHDGKIKRGHHITMGGPDAALFTDGVNVYFTEGASDAPELAEVSALGGETAKIPVTFGQPQLLDLSRSRSELLVSGQVAPLPTSTLWALPVPGGVPRQLNGVTGRDGSWSPDGKTLAFVEGSDLYLAKRDGSDARKLAALPGPGWMPRWSPDGKIMRFSVFDVHSASIALWEIGINGQGLRRLLQNWNTADGPIDECCGSWTPDGHDFVFQTTRLGRSETWSMPTESGVLSGFLLRIDKKMFEPRQLTNGQLSSLAPVLSPDGRKLFVIGQQLRSEMQRFDERTRQFVPYRTPSLTGISADFVDISRDGQWIAYVDFPEGTLWRSRIDGSERLQLTAPPMQVMVPFWSPDGSEIVFYGYNSGKRPQAYIVSAQGGDMRPAQVGGGSQMSMNWSPDSKSLMYSEFPFFAPDPSRITIHILDLKTQAVEDLPGSRGMFDAAWSPDGSHVAAWGPNGRDLMLFQFKTGQWTQIATGSGFPTWSRNGQYIYFIRPGEEAAVMRVRIVDKHVEAVASLKGVRLAGRLAGIALNLTPEGDPLVLRDVGTEEVYALDWHSR
jgi:Tol biopolymer transport system component/DNA-binding winged helix-turn-helix (wHTH) protein